MSFHIPCHKLQKGPRKHSGAKVQVPRPCQHVFLEALFHGNPKADDRNIFLMGKENPLGECRDGCRNTPGNIAPLAIQFRKACSFHHKAGVEAHEGRLCGKGPVHIVHKIACCVPRKPWQKLHAKLQARILHHFHGLKGSFGIVATKGSAKDLVHKTLYAKLHCRAACCAHVQKETLVKAVRARRTAPGRDEPHISPLKSPLKAKLESLSFKRCKGAAVKGKLARLKAACAPLAQHNKGFVQDLPNPLQAFSGLQGLGTVDTAGAATGKGQEHGHNTCSLAVYGPGVNQGFQGSACPPEIFRHEPMTSHAKDNSFSLAPPCQGPACPGTYPTGKGFMWIFDPSWCRGRLARHRKGLRAKRKKSGIFPYCHAFL